jgi:hypothetical protein
MYYFGFRKILMSLFFLLLTTEWVYACDTRQNDWYVDYTNNYTTPMPTTNGFNIVKFTFEAQDKKVTPSQVPKCDKENLPKTYTIIDKNKISFFEGRKGSSDVATYFNNLAPPNKNVYNHTAGSLNFAFHGNMHITLSGGGLIGNQDYTINDIVVAQGSSGSTNNWWLGGKTCSNIGDKMVRCAGYPSGGGHGAAVFISFARATGAPDNKTFLQYNVFNIIGITLGYG